MASESRDDKSEIPTTVNNEKYIRDLFENLQISYIDENGHGLTGNKIQIKKVEEESKKINIEIQSESISKPKSVSSDPSTSVLSEQDEKNGTSFGNKYIKLINMTGGTPNLSVDGFIQIIIKNNTNLTSVDRFFINKKTEELINIETQIMGIQGFEDKYKDKYSLDIKPLMYRLHRNVLYLYLRKINPTQSENLNTFLKLTGDKLQKFNEIIKEALERKEDKTQSVLQSLDEKDIKKIIDQIKYDTPETAELITKKVKNLLEQYVYNEPSAESKKNNIETAVKVYDAANNLNSISNPEQREPLTIPFMNGGADPTSKDILNEISFVYKLYSFYNNDIIIRIFAITSNEAIFKQFIIDINNIDTNKSLNSIDFMTVLKFFFIDTTNFKEIVNLLNDTEYKECIERDGKIYNKIEGKDNINIIFNYKLLKLMIKSDALIQSTLIYSKLITLTNLLINNYTSIHKFYNNITSKPDFIQKLDNAYQIFVDNSKKVYSYIKIRSETTNNPRYKYIVDKTKTNVGDYSGYLYLSYINVDGKVGFNPPGKYSMQEANRNLDAKQISFGDEDEKKKLLNKVTRKEYYYFGQFDGIYVSEEPKKIATDLIPLLNKLLDGEDVCVIGYGQSGSGKTSSLIYLNDTKTNIKKDGILIELCNKLHSNYKKVEMKMKNIYLWHNNANITNMNNIKINDYYHHSVKYKGTETINFYYDNAWYYFDDRSLLPLQRRTLGNIINAMFDLREVEPTPNNPDSSRSHVIVCLTFISTEDKKCNLIICDLAGVENVFNCDDINEIKNFDEKYSVSKLYHMGPGDITGKNTIKLDKYLCDQQEGTNGREKNTTNNENQKPLQKSDVKIYNQKLEEIKEIINDQINFKGGDPPKCDEEIKFDTSNCQRKLQYMDTSFNDINKYIEFIKTKKKEIKNELNKFLIDNNVNIKFVKYIIEQGDKILLYFKEGKKDGNIDDITESSESQDVFENKFEYEIQSLLTIFNKVINDLDNGTINKNEEVIAINKLLSNYKIITPIKKNGQVTTETKPTNIKNINIQHINIVNVINNTITYIKNIGNEEGRKLQNAAKKNREKELLELQVIEVTNFNKKYKLLKGISVLIKSYADLMSSSIKKEKTDEYMKLNCELDRIIKLQYNCILRKNEGYTINASLKKLREDIQKTIRSSLKNNTFYEKNIFPYCRNINLDDNIYDMFYKKKEDVNGDVGVLYDVIQQFSIVMDNITFMVFTVLNFTNDGIVNNPPNPPYINLNNIIYYTKIKYNKEKLFIHLNALKIELSKFDFYKDFHELDNLDEIIESGRENITINSLKIIEYINNNNAATLIGSLESTEILQNTTYNKLVCSYNKDLDNKLIRFRGAKLNTGSKNYDNIIKLNNKL